MNWRKGFTLIELLIVVTILAILAGAAVPYVQDYVEDSKFSRAKVDLATIKAALVLYETKRSEVFRPEVATSVLATELAQRGYLTRLPLDPWGNPYYIDPGSGTVRSFGPDGVDTSGDDIRDDYQPSLALRSAFWIDTDGNNAVNAGDGILFKFSRPLKSKYSITGVLGLENDPDTGDFTVSTLDSPTYGSYKVLDEHCTLISVPFAAPTFIPGRSTVTIPGAGATGFITRHDPPRQPQADTMKILQR